MTHSIISSGTVFQVIQSFFVTTLSSLTEHNEYGKSLLKISLFIVLLLLIEPFSCEGQQSDTYTLVWTPESLLVGMMRCRFLINTYWTSLKLYMI